MKNIFKFSALLALCAFVGLTGCTEELSTEQFSDDTVVFSAFAPNPVVRGAELRIVGSNLDRIVEVQIPGADPITDIEVISSGKISEIRVTTPKAGAEDVSVTGSVVIIDDAGNTYTSRTALSFTEGIVLDSFEPASAMPGDVITVKGDYLYNVQQIVLNNNVYVTGDQITEKSRRELKFIVPSAAVTGPVTIGDVDENNNPDGLIPNNIPSETVLTIGSPTVKAEDRGTLKAGAEITVKGTFLDMIEKAAFKVTTPAADEGAEATVAYTDVEFELAEDHNSIKVVLPATVVDGEIELTSFAGETFNAGAYKTVVPSDLAIAAETRYKAGLNAVISGKDLDLVTGASLAGTALAPVLTDGKLTFTIPAEAVDGVVTLTLANGKTVDTEAIELVKPMIAAMSPLELYAGDENIVVTGEDLDLVTGVTLGGRAAEYEYADGQIEVVTSLTSVSGKVVLTLANGVIVESADEVKVNYHSKVIVTEMPAMQHIGEEVVLKGSNFSLVENIFIGDVKVTQYSLRTDEEVRFLMPWNKAGMYNIQFHLFEGDVETVATQIEVGLERVFNTIWEGESYVTWSGGAVTNLSWGGYDWTAVKAGTTILANFEVVDDGAAVRFGNGSWAALPTSKTLTGADADGNISVAKGTTYLSFRLSAEDLAELQNNGGLVMCGTGFNITSIVLISEISQEVTLWEGEADPQSYAVNLELGGADNSSWRDAGIQVGQIVKVYFNLIDPAKWSVQMWGGHWGDMVAPQWNQDNSDGSLGYVSFEITDALYTNFMESLGWGQSFILQGEGLIFTKITIL